MEPALVVGGVPVFVENGVVRWTAGLAVDADGAPNAYAPPGSGLKPLDALANAGRPGNWWGIVTHTGRPDGIPIIQTASDPAPGYYVSTTSLIDRSRPRRDPRRYVDSTRVPYLAIPPEILRLGVKLGDVAHVAYKDRSSPAVVADVGPRGKIGEGSIALAVALGLDGSPRRGGTSAGVECAVFCGSSRGWPRTEADPAERVDLAEQVEQLRPCDATRHGCWAVGPHPRRRPQRRGCSGGLRARGTQGVRRRLEWRYALRRRFP